MRPLPLKGTVLTVLLLALWPYLGHAQCTLACQSGTVEIPLDASCIAPVTPEELLAPANTCGPGGFSLVILDSNNQPIPGNVLTDVHLYQFLNATVTHVGFQTQNCQVIIRPVDKVVCPSDVTINLSGACQAQGVFLPPAGTDDACNQIVLVQISASFGTGPGPHNVPVGVRTVTYTAFTANADSVACTMRLSVLNNQGPTVSCQNLSPSLQPSGTLTLPAISFIASQSDPCGIVLREVRRVSPGATTFGPSVSFNCADVGIPVTVRVRVTNASGLRDSCDAIVMVNDKTGPLVLECAADTVVACDAYTGNPNDYGDATFFDFCGPAPDVAAVDDQRDKCGVGLIRRIFTATDPSGNSSTCVQVIQIVNSKPLTESLITWPEDYVLEGCVSPSAVHPDSLAPPYSRPVVDGSICSIVAIGYKDETLVVNNPGCFKIFRTWTVVDCCIHNPQDPNSPGVFTYTQMIKVIDNDPPVLNCPPTLPVSVGPNCSVIFANLPDITADDCNPKVKITNNSPFSINKGPNASGNYPLGVTPVTFFASDGCGNFSSCKVDVVVSDFSPPTPQCIHGLSTDLGLCEGEIVVKIMAHFFNKGSYDNCSAPGSLVYSFSADTSDNVRMYTCENKNDTVPVQMWVTDAAGNQAFCGTYIIIQDNFNLCPGGKPLQLGGLVQSPYGDPLEGVNVILSGDGQGQQITGVPGSFLFKDLPPGGTYTLSAGKSTQPLTGVSTYDLLLIQKHLLGVNTIQDPLKLLAADANLSGHISVADIIQLRKWILQPQPDVHPLKAWRFINPNQPMNPQNPLNTPDLEQITIGPLKEDLAGVEMMAVKVGDVSGDAFNGGYWDADTRSERPILTFHSGNEEFQAGKSVEWTLQVRELIQLQALQMALAWDPALLAFEGVQTLPNALKLDNGHFGISDIQKGILRLSWSDAHGGELNGGEALFRLRFRALGQGSLSESVHLIESVLPSEAVWAGSECPAGIKVDWLVAQEEEVPSYALYQNKPNPFRDMTMIGFRLPQAAEVTLRLFTPGGQVITEFRGKYPPGYHEMSVPGEILPPNGVIFYRLDAPGFSETKKMIRQ
jgi:hypothetical protein